MASQVTIPEEGPLQADLFYKNDAERSDKEYHVSLAKVDGGWQTTVKYGKRGGNMADWPKAGTAPVTDFKTAFLIYNGKVTEKLREGYLPRSASTLGHVPKPVQSVPVMEKQIPELLKDEIDPSDIGKYVVDPRWWFQEKADGDNRQFRRDSTSFYGYNRSGEPVDLPLEIVRELEQLPAARFLLPGEIEGTSAWIFSALELGADLRFLPFYMRYENARRLFAGLTFQHIQLLPVATTEDEKIAMIEDLRRRGREGFVVIDSLAQFKPGKSGQHFKVPFWKCATFRVRYHNPQGKDSVGIELLDGQTWVHMGNCTMAAKHGKPPVGSLIDVRYKWVIRGGHIYQPAFQRVRTDIPETSANIGQLKYKRETAEEAEAA